MMASQTRKASDTQVSSKPNAGVGREDHRDAEATERDERGEVDLPAVARHDARPPCGSVPSSPCALTFAIRIGLITAGAKATSEGEHVPEEEDLEEGVAVGSQDHGREGTAR